MNVDPLWTALLIAIQILILFCFLDMLKFLIQHNIFARRKSEVTQTLLATLHEEWMTPKDLFKKLKKAHRFLSPISLAILLRELARDKKVTFYKQESFIKRKKIMTVWCKPYTVE